MSDRERPNRQAGGEKRSCPATVTSAEQAREEERRRPRLDPAPPYDESIQPRPSTSQTGSAGSSSGAWQASSATGGRGQSAARGTTKELRIILPKLTKQQAGSGSDVPIITGTWSEGPAQPARDSRQLYIAEEFYAPDHYQGEPLTVDTLREGPRGETYGPRANSPPVLHIPEQQQHYTLAAEPAAVAASERQFVLLEEELNPEQAVPAQAVEGQGEQPPRVEGEIHPQQFPGEVQEQALDLAPPPPAPLRQARPRLHFRAPLDIRHPLVASRRKPRLEFTLLGVIPNLWEITKARGAIAAQFFVPLEAVGHKQATVYRAPPLRLAVGRSLPCRMVKIDYAVEICVDMERAMHRPEYRDLATPDEWFRWVQRLEDQVIQLHRERTLHLRPGQKELEYAYFRHPDLNRLFTTWPTRAQPTPLTVAWDPLLATINHGDVQPSEVGPALIRD